MNSEWWKLDIETQFGVFISQRSTSNTLITTPDCLNDTFRPFQPIIFEISIGKCLKKSIFS